MRQITCFTLFTERKQKPEPIGLMPFYFSFFFFSFIHSALCRLIVLTLFSRCKRTSFLYTYSAMMITWKYTSVCKFMSFRFFQLALQKTLRYAYIYLFPGQLFIYITFSTAFLLYIPFLCP